MRGMQKIGKGWLVGTLLVAGGMCHAEVEYKLKRYDVILDRSPFGSEPNPVAAVSAPDPAVQQKVKELEKTYRLSFLLENDAGEIRAGFQRQNTSAKSTSNEPTSSIIMVGESFMGMKLKSIDMETSEATLEHNGKPIIFRLTKAPEKVSPSKSPAKSRRFGSRSQRPPPSPKPNPLPEPKLSPEEQELRRVEIRQNLQDYQMEVIRKGMPPLPVPLTKEMDDQLVEEGVLPPSL